MSFSYTADGLLATLAEKDQISHFAYTSAGKLSKVTFSDGASHQYTYDKLGFRKQTIRSDSSSVSYRYDSIGNLKTSTVTDIAEQKLTETHRMNHNNQVVTIDLTGQDSLAIKYNQKGHPQRVIRGTQTIEFGYDKSGRLTHVDDSEKGLFSYDYKNDEVDIRLQLDSRTRPQISHLNKVGSHNQNQFALAYARVNGSPWQAVSWNESLGKFLLPSPRTLHSPDASYQSAKKRRRLHDATAVTQSKQQDFDKDSNSFFLPAEYSAIGCVIDGEGDECGGRISYVHTHVASGLTVGDVAHFTTHIGLSADCAPEYSFGFQGYVATNTTGVFDVPLTSSGTHNAVITAECCGSIKWFAQEVVVAAPPTPTCSVDFNLTATNSFKISATPTMPTITAKVTQKTPSNAMINWTAKIEHNAPIDADFCSGSTDANSPVINGTGDSFKPSWGAGIYGGDLKITATCSAAGYKSQSKTIDNKTITGTEPSSSLYDTRLAGGLNAPLNTYDLRRIACKESHLKHFEAGGMPNYSGTGRGDVGVMQICFQRQTTHIWNYLSNISYARTILNQKIGSARNSLNAQLAKPGATAWTQLMLREETIHRYNAGNLSTSDRYWNWDTSNNRWEIVDVGGVGGYYLGVNQKAFNCLN